MAKKIEPELQTISKYLLLKDFEYFYIPPYQRCYTWDKERLDKLWDDIVNYDEKKDDNYFLGTVILSIEENDKRLALIDGQQRTTTLLILLKAILIKINSLLKDAVVSEETEELFNALNNRRKTILKLLYKQEEDKIKSRYDENNDDKIYKDESIKLYINNSMNEEYKDELLKILQAKDYDDAEEKAIKIPYKKQDNKYCILFKNFKYLYNKINALDSTNVNSVAKKLLEKCECIVIKSWQVDQAINMFNSLNSDGMPLEDSDIISSIMYIEAQKRGCHAQLKELWEELKSKNNDLVYIDKQSLTPILTQYMYCIRALNGETKTKTGIDVNTPGLRRYYKDINKTILQEPINTTQILLQLVKIWIHIQNYPIIRLLLLSNDNAKIFMAGYLYRFIDVNDSTSIDKIRESDVKVVAESLLRLFVILELVEAGYSSKLFKTFLFEIENDFVDNEKKEKEIKKKFDSHISNNWKQEDLEKALKEYNGNFLVQVEEYLLSREEKVDIKYDNHYDIEHIMPKSGKNIESIKKDAKINDNDEFNYYLDKIGNKILLENSINRTIGNAWFREKVQFSIKDKKGYVDSSFPNAQSLVNKYKNKPNEEIVWTKADIDYYTDIKTKRLINFIFGE